MSRVAIKPHKSYAELAQILQSRGVQAHDQAWVERKLAQVGYYRLSGYWHPCRILLLGEDGQSLVCPVMNKPLRGEQVLEGTTFKSVFDLYLLDKRLRLALLDALERIEVHVRSVVAHELGYLNPLAYQDEAFIDPKHLPANGGTAYRGGSSRRSYWSDWRYRHDETLGRSQEDWIEWHRQKGTPIPFWAVIEAWDFGTLSRYYSLLRGKFKGRIASRLGIKDFTVFEGWLRELNTMRNRCAHHTRVWNQTYARFRDLPGERYFQRLNLSENARTRVYGYIAVLWFLLQRIGPASTWLDDVADVIDNFPELPGCSRTALGLHQEMLEFPRELLRTAAA